MANLATIDLNASVKDNVQNAYNNTIAVNQELEQKADYQDLIDNDLIKATASKTLYVATTGNDTTGDGTSDSPYATIQKAIDTIPKNMNACEFTIQLSAGEYTEFSVKHLQGGILNIKGGTDNTEAENYIVTTSCSLYKSDTVRITGLTFNNSLGIFRSVGNIYYCNFPTNSNVVGVIVDRGSNFSILRTNITGRTYGAYASQTSTLSIWATTISSCATAISAGVSSGTSSVITMSSTTLTSNTVDYHQPYGGTIIKDGIPINVTNKIDTLFESGTFTPTLAGSTTTGTFTTSIASGKYYKTNKEVFIQVKLRITATSGAVGNLVIGGLPFVPNDIYSVVIDRYKGISLTSGYNQLGGYVSSDSKVYLLESGSGKTTNNITTVDKLTVETDLFFTCSYLIN